MTPVDALQTALAAEHAALYVYGALGARTSQSATPVLFAEVSDAYSTHRAWRDLLTSRLVDEGAEPTPAAPTYELPTGVARAAVEVEERCATTYAYVVANTVRSGPDLGHRRAHQVGDAPGGVRGGAGGAARRRGPRLRREQATREVRRRGTPEIFLDAGSSRAAVRALTS